MTSNQNHFFQRLRRCFRVCFCVTREQASEEESLVGRLVKLYTDVSGRSQDTFVIADVDVCGVCAP